MIFNDVLCDCMSKFTVLFEPADIHMQFPGDFSILNDGKRIYEDS